MPYIKPEDRKKWNDIIYAIEAIVQNIPPDKLDGELNYLISRIMGQSYTPGYFNYNRCIGLLECIKQEFYRKKVAPYEDKKIQENGDLP